MESQFRLMQVDATTVCVWLHTANDPAPEEWTQHCGIVADLVRRKAGDLTRVRGFVVSDGGGPNALQRRQVLKAWGDSVRTAVVTPVFMSGFLKRGITIALSWIQPNLRFFAPLDILRAIEHIGIDKAGFKAMLTSMREMEAHLVANRTLEILTSAIERLPVKQAPTTVPLTDLYGPYEAVRRLGSGGTADIFEARHVETGTRVALKVLRDAAVGDERAIRRVVAEARAVSALRHANVVRVIDVSTRDKVPYLVMELLTGEDVAHWISRSKALTVEQAVDLAFPILSGVCAVHAAGLVHGDLKPSNVFLAQREGKIEPVIVDFGIAKFVDSAGWPTTTLLGAGTPPYMAPEQVRGLRARPESDQYALGAVL
jgi:tRNA A-37 threonylcarbamoyl transferase component Bud32